MIYFVSEVNNASIKLTQKEFLNFFMTETVIIYGFYMITASVMKKLRAFCSFSVPTTSVETERVMNSTS